MNRLYVLCGIPGIGKSTWVKEVVPAAGRKSVHISRDEIRFSIVTEDEEYFAKEEEVFNAFILAIKNAINSNTDADIFVDATHLNVKSRAKLLSAIGKNSLDECILLCAINFPNDLEKAILQNENRTGRRRVPKSVIRRMSCCFEPATMKEGFDMVLNL